MKIALLHDYLNQYGGAERVLEAFCEIFPDAPIYTLFYDKEKTLGKFEGKTIKTSFLNCSFSEKGHNFTINRHRLFIPLMPLAASLMKVDDDFDVVLSSSAGFGKGIAVGKNTVHVSYCHTPLRYAWEHYKYFNWRPVLKFFSAPAFWCLRRWDRFAGQKPEKLIANSKYIAEKIKNYYGREAEVIYPPVDTEKFFPNKRSAPRRDMDKEKSDYFLVVGRMVHYKKFDLIIQAFNKLNLPLLIVGNGPELSRLKKMAKSPKIEFLPFATDDHLNFLYNGARALVFPQVEDFGLIAAEAQACGTPVIALNQGGAKEIVEDGKTGILFNNQTVDDLIIAIQRFQIEEFDSKMIRESALRFSKNKFKKSILKAVYRARNGED